ncbi:hypothetical protein [Gemmobacter sp.]|uniref:hypothetical protein n=1 Tax=Gemmobacter sp. TaxID=1898957 RepID=UPI002AFFDFBB|nr:hypothetical protein [Gemmobacter sp.]
MPARARVTSVVSAIGSAGVIEACGLVSGIEMAGIYGPYRAFHGVLGTNVAGTRVFAPKVARTPIEQVAIQRLCVAAGMDVNDVSASQDSSNDETRRLLVEVREMQRRCAGPEGDAPGAEVCTYRDGLAAHLNDLGWCWGIEGQSAEQADWHVCQPNSVRAPRY